jgi:3-mercaptopyruvate sulfurtransferase SseA
MLACLALPVGCAKKEEPKPSASSSSNASPEHKDFGELTVEQLQAKMDEAKAGKLALTIYDNNSKERWEGGHIPGARWVDYKNVQASDLPADKSATLVFYCANEH